MIKLSATTYTILEAYRFLCGPLRPLRCSILFFCAYKSKQFADPFCRPVRAFASRKQGQVARKSALNARRMSPHIEFVQPQQFGSPDRVTTCEFTPARSVDKTQKPREPRTSQQGDFSHYATIRAGQSSTSWPGEWSFSGPLTPGSSPYASNPSTTWAGTTPVSF